jgi:hypothetical protein
VSLLGQQDGESIVRFFVMAKKRENSIIFALLVICVGVSLLILNAPPINGGPFLGDDYLALQGHNNGYYASDYQESLRNTSLDKWRPFNTLFMGPLLNIFGDSYRNFYFFSTVLLALASFAFWTTHKTVTSKSESSPTWVALLGVIVIGSSPFTFMARSGVYGWLEIGPIILCLYSFSLYQRGKMRESRRLVVYSSLIALTAGLIHERFFMFSIALAIMIAWQARTLIRWRGLWLAPFGNVLFYVYSAVIVLNANILKGGGESKLNESVGLWIAHRFVFASLSLLGGSGGDVVYFDPAQPTQFVTGLGFSGNYSLPSMLAIVIVFLLFLWALFRPRTKNYFPITGHHRFSGCFVESIVVAILLLIPAATVESRIEARWLFGSLVFLVLAITSLPLSKDILTKVTTGAFLGLMIILNSVSMTRYQNFDFWRVRAEEVLRVVQNNEPKSGPWNIAIVWPDLNDNNVVVEWALGYGDVLRKLNNGPDQILFGTRERILECPNPCLVVDVTDSGPDNPDIRDTTLQKIQTRWKN